MQNNNKKELAKKVNELINAIGNYDYGSDEYRVVTNLIGKHTQTLETLDKISSNELKIKLDEKRHKEELELKQKEFDLKEQQHALEVKKYEFDGMLAQNKLDFEKNKLNQEAIFKSKELEIKEKYEKKAIAVTIATCAIPAVLGLVSNIFAMRYYNKLAIRALNMEYIDNSITPRSYNECMNNINKFVSKK